MIGEGSYIIIKMIGIKNIGHARQIDSTATDIGFAPVIFAALNDASATGGVIKDKQP